MLSMLCNYCKHNTAVCRVRASVDGVIHDRYLCAECRAKLTDGSIDKRGADYEEYFGSAGMKPDVVCPACNTPYSEYEKTGILGCAQCYNAFRSELTATVKQVHGKSKHTGKSPLGTDLKYELVAEKKKLVAEFEKATRENRLNDATQINSAIEEINKVLYKDIGPFGK